MSDIIISLSAFAALLPALVLSYRSRSERPEPLFLLALAVAVAGPLTQCVVLLSNTWQSGFSVALWFSVSASMAIYFVLTFVMREIWRLAPLLLTYLVVLSGLALIWGSFPEQRSLSGPADTWLKVHITVSVVTYALCTIAAVAGAGVFLQERAVKRKQLGEFMHRLPSIADAESLQIRLLVAAEVVLGLGILSGMAESQLQTGMLLELHHKVLLSLLAFAVIAVLLLLHYRSGLRGRRAARIVLVAYLLLTLAYPGVKFITDVLIG